MGGIAGEAVEELGADAEEDDESVWWMVCGSKEEGR